MDRRETQTRLSAARTRLILDHPFLGALVLRLPLIEADPKWCKSVATDTRSLYYNAEYVDDLDLAELQFVLAHEALHCALSHFSRREHRIRHCWDVACDYAINPLLIAEGLTPPPGALHEKSFEGMTAEEIYPFIQDHDTEETLDTHLYDQERSDDREGQGEQPRDAGGQDTGQSEDGGGGSSGEPEQTGGAPQPPPLSKDEREALGVQWQQRLAGAAQQAMQAGKLGGEMARLVDHLLQPRLPWRMLLARYVSSTARDDYSFMRPSTRRGSDAIFPSLRSGQIELVVALDVSGSVTGAEMGEFLSEIDAIKSNVRASVTLLACDAELAEGGPWRFEPWEEFRLPREFKGGGGTRFAPVFDWVARQDRQPDLLIYFTDAQGEFPSQEPPYPVIWLVKGKHGVAWGQRIQLN
jgi:predicted metal-dependent peptidase